MGDRFQTGPVDAREQVQVDEPVRRVVGRDHLVIFILPDDPGGVPLNDEFDWNFVNYAPLVTGGLFLAVGIWWLVSAKRTFTGPRHTISELDAELGGRARRRGPAVAVGT